MDEESNGTWELVSLPSGKSGKSTVGCRWVYTVKYLPDGSVERLKARLVAKGYTQTYGVDYMETFSPTARLNSVRVILSVAVTLNWPLFQLDVKNAFLHGDLQEEVYMDQPLGYVMEGHSGIVCRLKKAIYGLKQSPRAWFDKFSSVVVTYDDSAGITNLKSYLARSFHTKDLGLLRYFLGIEVARSKEGIYLSQRKYVIDSLTESGMLGSKPVDTPMDSTVKLDIASY
ncbi:hypothetical protein ACHQM5_023936 [Ranunculus cassubicifolius]